MELVECCLGLSGKLLHTKAFKDEEWQELASNWIQLLSVSEIQSAILCKLGAQQYDWKLGRPSHTCDHNQLRPVKLLSFVILIFHILCFLFYCETHVISF